MFSSLGTQNQTTITKILPAKNTTHKKIFSFVVAFFLSKKTKIPTYRSDKMMKSVEETAAVPVTNMEKDGNPSIVATNLAASDDPFAHRDGKTLLWRNVNMVLVR